MATYDSLTTRMPNGVTNAAPWQTMGASGAPDPTWSHLYGNDFDIYIPTHWTTVLVGTGTQVETDFDGGAVLITNSAGATDATYSQLKNAGFKFDTKKAHFFKFAGVLSAVMLDVFYCGMVQKGATTIATITDGIYISKVAGSAALTLNVVKASMTVSAPFPALETLAAGTYFEVGFMVDYLGNVAGFFNPTTGSNPISAGAGASGVQPRGRQVSIANPPLPTTVLMTPGFGLTNTSAVANTLTIDFIVAADER